jgi:hypothetical protein
MESLYKNRRALKRLFYVVVECPHAYSNEQYIYTLEMLQLLLNKNKIQINQWEKYCAVNNEW